LSGFAFSGAPGPVKHGFVPLGELTAVIGANDAGKSRLVRTFASSLASATDPERGRAAFFASHSDDETRALLWVFEDWNESFEVSFSRESAVSSVLAAVSALHDEGDFPGWTDLVNELEGSRMFAFVPVDSGGGRAWGVYWCLPWEGEAGRDARSTNADPLSPTDSKQGLRTGRLLDQGWPIPRADDAGPMPIVYLGVAPIWWLPMPVFVPAAEQSVVASAAEAITGTGLSRVARARGEVAA
jgi:hypothetical protein